jgi:hypothetical protein
VATTNTIDNLTFTTASNQGDVYGISTGTFVAGTLINFNTIKI